MMYRIENYITSIILSKVDRYIKNFRREDVKVSLWKGDCVLYNLDLDLDVLEQELSLPFSLTSGHIHQLQIHVPWTRLNSESVQVTINTIECVMRLKSGCQRSSTAPPAPPTTKQVNTDENMAPSSYLTSLVNKILCNLSVTCNNLILKYVEEDIVLSMNIKTLSLTTVNSSWTTEYSELTTTDLILRKLISLVDVTICLDKRNASGRIESYLKPLLYKCSMVVRLSRSYPSVNSCYSSSTRTALHCDDFNLSISQPQVSMLLRLYFSIRTAIAQSRENSYTSILSQNSNSTDFTGGEGEEAEGVGWSSWLWGLVPTIAPRLADSMDSVTADTCHSPLHKFHLGLYIQHSTLDLKLCRGEETSDWESMLQVVLGGCFLELTSNTSDWSNIQFGICSAHVSPLPNNKQETYLECGEVPSTFFSSSLFANPDIDLTQRPWEYHLSTVTETLMMERAPTFYMDYISIIEKDDCFETDEPIKEEKERQLVRYVVGPVCISIGSQLLDKLTVVKQSLYSYDYSHYTHQPASTPQVTVLSNEDIELFKATVDSECGYYVPQHTSQFTFFGARIKIFPSDSSYLQQSTGGTWKGGPPYILVKVKCLDGKLTRPVMPEKLSALSAHFHVPDSCIAAAQTTLSLLLVEARVGIVIRDMEGPDAFQISNLSWSGMLNNVFRKESRDSIIKHSSLLIEKLMLFSTKPKLILGWEILFSLLSTAKKSDLLYNTSLLRDCRNTNESIYLELKMKDCEGKYLLRGLSECCCLSVGSLSGSTVLTREALRETVLSTTPSSPPQLHDNFLEIVMQRPVGGEWFVAPLLSVKLSRLNMCLGRNLCLYIMYSPQTNHIRAFNIMQTSGSARKISTSSLSSLQKKQLLEQRKRTPSQSDILPPFIVNYLSSAREEGLRVMSVVISGDVSGLTVVLPGPRCGGSLVLTLGSLSIRSPSGRINYDLKQLPVIVDNWNQNKVNFPWSVFLCDCQGYSSEKSSASAAASGSGPRLPLLSKVNSTLTLALTTRSSSGSTAATSTGPVAPPNTAGDNDQNDEEEGDGMRQRQPTAGGGAASTVIALCLHIDTTPISLSLSHHQVVLLSEVSASLYQVYRSLVPMPAGSADPQLVGPAPSAAPCQQLDHRPPPTSDDSLSNRTPVGGSAVEVEEVVEDMVEVDGGRVKVTVWLQCTVTKCSLALYSVPAYPEHQLKFVLDIDDIFMTLDVVPVYQKMKLKVATAQAKHYTRLSGNTRWRPGCFSGTIMKGNETKSSDTKDSDDFLSVTLTRASAANLHRRLNQGFKPHTRRGCGREFEGSSGGGGSGYVSEAVVKVQPLDFVVSPVSVGRALEILEPLLDQQDVFPLGRNYSTSPIYGQSVFNLTTSSLPLLYLDMALMRIFVPMTVTGGSGTGGLHTDRLPHDTLYIQVDRVSVSSEAVNPVSRKFVRCELYERHGSRLTTVPGARLEDRQYQLDSNITLSTGRWCEVVKAMEDEEEGAGGGQNPAVYWNSAQHQHQTLQHSTTALLAPLALTVIVAPPIATSGFIISGLNVEVNIVSEVDLSLDLEQVRLLTGLYGEAVRSFPFQMADDTVCGAGSVDQGPEPSFSDSGVESVDDSSLQNTAANRELIEIPACPVVIKSSSISQMSMSTPTSINTRRYHQRSQTVPMDMLVTTKAVVAKLYRRSVSRPGDAACEPLLFLLASQPYMALEKQADLSVFKGSLYEVEVRHGSAGHLEPAGAGLTRENFPVALVQNRSGDPHPDKGIPPALFNFTSTTHGLRPSTIDVEFGRPVKFLFKSSSIDYMNNLKDTLLQTFYLPEPVLIPKDIPMKKSSSCILNRRHTVTVEQKSRSSTDHFKSYFHSCSVFNVNTKQMVFDFQTAQPDKPGCGCLVSVGSVQLSAEWSEAGWLSSRSQVSAVCLSDCRPDPHLVVGPWTLAASLTRDPKLPSLSVTIDAGLLPIDLSKHAITNLTAVCDEFKPYLVRSGPENHQQLNIDTDGGLDEHHYRDDLQAGAFQFVTSSGVSGCDGGGGAMPLPLAYQVTFPSSRVMAWTYPAPRAITSLTLLPLPSPEPECESEGMRVTVEYLECGVWREWTHLVGNSCASVEAVIPPGVHVSSTWRAHIKSCTAMPHVSALATALRVSSVFSPTIVPSLTLRLDLHSLQVCVWRKQRGLVGRLSGSLSRYRVNSWLPPSYPVCTVFVEPLQAFLTHWQTGDVAVEVDMCPRLDVLNPRTLLQQCCVQPCSLSVKARCSVSGTVQQGWEVSMVTSPVVVRLAPPLCHTLLAATRGALLTPYVICNDSLFPIRFGQMGTVEDIVLDSLSCNFYAWRSSKQQALLRFSLSRQIKMKTGTDPPLTAPHGVWSEGVCLDKESILRLQTEDDGGRTVTLLVAVKHLSPILTQVVVGGQLLIYNMLDEGSVDCRLVSSSISERQRQVTLGPSARAPALALSPDSKYSLRLSTVPNRWSGLVPLMTNNNVWMVKIPLEDKDQYMSAWCQIVQEEGSVNHPRLLVILSPIYLLRSYLPCESNVVITTEGFPGTVSQTVPGRGITCNLKALGTAAHTHTLDFNIEGVETEGGGGICLSYKLVEGRGPAPGPVPPLPRLLELADARDHLVGEWPPLSATAGGLSPSLSYSWARAPQPNTLTHVKVKFGYDLLKVTNSLMVELQPWALLINTTGFHILLVKNGVTLASLPHFSIVAPPQLQGSFKLGVDVESSGVHMSGDIELSQNQVFYMPQISGIVPLSGQLNVNISASDKVICINLQSNISNGIRVVHASSSFTIINMSSYELCVAPLLVYRENSKLLVPRVIDSYSLSLPRQSINSKPVSGVGLAKWYKIGECGRSVEGRHYLLLECDSMVSSPIPVSLQGDRHVHTALIPTATNHRLSGHTQQVGSNKRSSAPANIALTVVVHTVSGQTYITIDDQPIPQLVIHNETGVNLVVTKASPTRGGGGIAVDDFPDWEWRLTVPNGRRTHYFIGQQDVSRPPALVLSRPEINSWSNSISVVGSTSGRLVTVPQCHDLTASVSKRGSTTHVRLTPANQRIVAASDIRSRLSNMHVPAMVVGESVSPSNDTDESKQEGKIQENSGHFSSTCSNGNLFDSNSLTELDLSGSDAEAQLASQLSVKAELKNLTLILCSEAPHGYHWVDVASLSLDNVCLTSCPSSSKDDGATERCVNVDVSEIQLDNEEYQRGGYDFGVVLLCKSNKQTNTPALQFKLLFDTDSTPALQDVVLNVSPLQAFIEDVYVTRLKDQMSKMLPEISVIGTDESEMSQPVLDTSKEREEEVNTNPIKKKAEEEAISENTNQREDDDELFNVSDSEVEQESRASESCPRTKATEPRGDVSLPLRSSESQRCSSSGGLESRRPAESLPFPQDVLLTALELSRPLRLRSFCISATTVTVSVHTSTRFYIALDNSPLQFGSFQRKELVTTPYRLGHALSLHYFLGAIYGTGWAIGSVELLGAPAGLARSVGTGLKSFITLPCRGAVDQGPAGFFTGFLHGSASLMKHLTAGTVMSVTKLAGSWSRTLDRLTLQDEDLKYAEEMRRVRPEGLTQALKLGLTELGVNILGGVGGLAQKPLEYVASGNQSLASTLGLALVGVITRPLSGAAELLALTGQGILAGAGWTDNHLPKHEGGGGMSQLGSESRLRYSWKYLPNDECLLSAVEAMCCLSCHHEDMSTTNFHRDERPCVALLTTRRLCIIDSLDNLARSYDLISIEPSSDASDPLKIDFHSTQDCSDNVETYSKRRIEEFIRESGRALRKSPSISYAESMDRVIVECSNSVPILHLYLSSPATKVHFLSLLCLAKRHRSNLGFPIMSG